jgi:UrcA family protein
MKTFTTLTAAVVLGVVSMNTAIADTQFRSVTVQYGDLDLNRAESTATLYKRIKSAAADLCSAVDGRMLTQQLAFSRCVRGALDHAVASADIPALSQYASTQHGSKPTIKSATVASSR